MKLIQKIDDMGGFVKALETGYPQNVLAESAHLRFEKIRTGKTIRVGQNKYVMDEKPVPVFRPDPHGEKEAIKRVKDLKDKRNSNTVSKKLEAIRYDIKSNGPLIPSIIEAVKVDATLGEIWKVLKEEYGWLHLKNC
jgi:methylmalonyl-CoA mutase N-terminal domain/subunit